MPSPARLDMVRSTTTQHDQDATPPNRVRASAIQST
jgi:hypothetical protein